jgi:hypothetical protein
MVIYHLQQHTKNPWIILPLWVEVLLPKLDDDFVVAHMWADQSWLFGAKTSVSLEEKSVQEIADAAFEVNPDVIVFFHGHLSL